MSRSSDQDRELQDLYAKLPSMECKGDCWEICKTALAMSTRERARIEKRHGRLTPKLNGWCTMLEDRRCKAHAIRPMICRLWGLEETMRCPHGCEPDPRYLTHDEALRFLMKADEIGGRPDHEAELARARIRLA